MILCLLILSLASCQSGTPSTTAAPQTTAEQTAAPQTTEALPKAMEAARKYTEEYNNSPTVIRPIELSY